MKKFFLLIISMWALYLMIALFSYNPFDPSWFQSTWPIYIYNKAGNIGAFLADLLFVIFGVIAYFIPFFIVMIYWNIFAQINSINFFILSFKLIGISILLLSLCGLVTLIFKDFNYFGSGGIIGDIVSRIIFLWCCGKGVVYYLLFILIIGILLITNFSLPIFIKKIFNYLIIDSLLNIYKRYYVKKNNNYFLYLYIMNRKLIIISFKKKIIKFKVFSFFYPINKKFVKFHTVPYVFVFMDSNYIQILDENIVFSKFDYSCFLISYRIFFIKHIFSIIELNTFLKNSVSDIIYNNIFKKKIFLARNNIFCKVKEFSYSTYIAYNYSIINNNILSKRHLDNNELIFDNIYYVNKLISKSSIQQRKSYKKQKIINDIPMNPNFSKKINKIALPSLKKNNQDSCLDNIAKLIELKLAEYQIKANVENILSGPVVTRFELNLAAGIKVVNVINISRDLARSLSVSMVKIIETIPGKPYIGLEIPNNKRQMVSFQELLNCDEFHYANSPLTLILGKNIIGQPVVNDLKNLIHILIAGTTGSGKSVGINVIILSLLYKATPEEVRLILIDPKMLELSVYTGIPHLLTEVVTDMKDVDNILHWCIKEMEYRYKLMSIIGVRNLASYNEQVSQSFYCHCPINNPLYNSNENCLQSSKKILNKLPYIVVIIDEFSDLIMVSGKKIEELIIKLTQKSRAAGIYLILTTQRPSINVITGLIKANIPTRIAFSVSSKIDSRIILDQNGAEMLLGMGDMLYLPAYSSIPIRVHGAFVQDKEIQEIIKYWKYNTQEKYTYHTINILNKRS